MNEVKEFNNVFKFSLKQGDIILGEKIFDADVFNPFTRYSINIREILPRAITKLQVMLSRKNYDTMACLSNHDIETDVREKSYIDLHEHYLNMLYTYPAYMRSEMFYSPQSIVQQIEERTIRGVECKIGLYINNNPIVERNFYVNGFNPIARWSMDLTQAVVDIADIIFDQIKKNDYKNMWDDYDLINHMGLTINQIRELNSAMREDYLRRLKR